MGFLLSLRILKPIRCPLHSSVLQWCWYSHVQMSMAIPSQSYFVVCRNTLSPTIEGYSHVFFILFPVFSVSFIGWFEEIKKSFHFFPEFLQTELLNLLPFTLNMLPGPSPPHLRNGTTTHHIIQTWNLGVIYDAHPYHLEYWIYWNLLTF